MNQSLTDYVVSQIKRGHTASIAACCGSVDTGVVDTYLQMGKQEIKNESRDKK